MYVVYNTLHTQTHRFIYQKNKNLKVEKKTDILLRGRTFFFCICNDVTGDWNANVVNSTHHNNTEMSVCVLNGVSGGCKKKLNSMARLTDLLCYYTKLKLQVL